MDERQFIFGTEGHDLKETKEVKMRLPIAYLIRLHGLKLLTGQNISDTVTQALEMYFAKAEAEKAERREAQAQQEARSAEQPSEQGPQDTGQHSGQY